MIRNGNNQLTNVSWLEESEKVSMIDYIRDEVNSWCKNNPNQSFAARTIFGGENYDWTGTPLIPLYEYYIELGDDDYAVKEAGIALWRLLKEVISTDENAFDMVTGSYVNTYTLVN